MIDSPYLIKPNKAVHFKKLKTTDNGPFKDREATEAATKKNLAKMHDLQEVLYAQGTQSLLIVLQAMDAGGKDGTIESLFSGVNPQGCAVTSFKQPSTAEKAHDFLWRHHAATPGRGMIGIFNRSHYESVLVERVHKIVTKDVWKKRYDHINAFEKLLADEGTTVVKFFLHISKEEQAERMQARLDDPKKHWKFSPADLEERKLWDHYGEAFGDALERCSTEHAPWYAIPADRKWFRNWAISDILLRTVVAMKPKFPPPMENLNQYKVV